MAGSREPAGTGQERDNAHVALDLEVTPEHDTSRLDTPASTSKQKRRRTSPRDHAILESAYQKNSKPDKEQRLNLVKLVDLGEKEVQIWFQNRRQNDRRKSKPLQPHELIPHFRNGIPVEASSQLPSPQNSQEHIPKDPANARAGAITSTPSTVIQASPRQSDLKALLNDSDPPASSSPAALRAIIGVETPALSTPPSSLESPSQNASRPDTSPVSAEAATRAQISRKRSHEEMTGNDQAASAAENPPKSAKSLQRTSSFVRLAVSADGSVKVRINDETTPSPPKRRPAPPPNMTARRSSGFTRAQSDVGRGFHFKDVGPATPGLIGRSRDARTWEFYCDRSARSSLAARAEEEATGSAVGALGLMRSASQRRVQALSPNPAKQNRVRRGISRFRAKPAIARTQSSMARLQSSDGTYDDDEEEEDVSSKKTGRGRHGSSGDSDKENWLPGTRDSVHDLRRTRASSGRGATLQEHGATAGRPAQAPTASTGANTQQNRPTVGAGKEKGDDLDCVQGLLSLSQGAWR